MSSCSQIYSVCFLCEENGMAGSYVAKFASVAVTNKDTSGATDG
jgi:hypothetical protein